MNAEAAKMNREAHRVIVEGRESMEVLGVSEVISFDDQAVLLKTACGDLSVEGASLHIRVLDPDRGLVTMDGRVDSINYYHSESSDKQGKHGFLGKLFR